MLSAFLNMIITVKVIRNVLVDLITSKLAAPSGKLWAIVERPADIVSKSLCRLLLATVEQVEIARDGDS